MQRRKSQEVLAQDQEPLRGPPCKPSGALETPFRTAASAEILSAVFGEMQKEIPRIAINRNKILLFMYKGLLDRMIFHYSAPSSGLASPGGKVMWKGDMKIEVKPGGAATVAGPNAFLCGLAGAAFAQYTGRSFQPQRFAEAA